MVIVPPSDHSYISTNAMFFFLHPQPPEFAAWRLPDESTALRRVTRAACARTSIASTRVCRIDDARLRVIVFVRSALFFRAIGLPSCRLIACERFFLPCPRAPFLHGVITRRGCRPAGPCLGDPARRISPPRFPSFLPSATRARPRRRIEPTLFRRGGDYDFSVSLI